VDEVVLIGGGGHAVVVAEAARRQGVHVGRFLDDDPLAPLSLGPVAAEHLGPLRSVANLRDVLVHLAVGDLPLRRSLIDDIEAARLEARSVIDPGAVVMSSVVLGRGVFVAAGAVVQARAAVGDWCIVNTGAIVEHECVLGPNVHVAPGAVLAGRVRVGADTLIGMGSRVLPGVRIGAGCVVGAGAVVTGDVPAGATVVGVPARSLA
jgi:UDP-perosamine 4-acetyltransferase